MNTKEIDLSKLANNKVIQFILNILFGISVVSLTFLLIEQNFASNPYIYIYIYAV